MNIFTKFIMIIIICIIMVQCNTGADGKIRKEKMFKIHELKSKADADSINMLMEYKNDEDPKVREYMIKAIECILKQRIHKFLVLCLIDIYRNDKDIKIRNEAKAVLVRLKDTAVFLEDLQSQDARIQSEAAMSLIEINTEEAVRAVISVLDNKNTQESFKKAVAIKVGKLGFPQVYNVLLEMQKDNPMNGDIYWAIVKIADKGDISAEEALNKIYASGGDEIKKKICLAAEELSKEYEEGGSYIRVNIKWQGISHLILNDIIKSLKEVNLDYDKLNIYYSILSYMEDEKYFIEAYNAARAYPELIKEIACWSHVFVPHYINPDRDFSLKFSVERLVKANLDEPRHEVISDIESLPLMFRNKNMFIGNNKIVKDLKEIMHKLLKAKWVNDSGNITLSKKGKPNRIFSASTVKRSVLYILSEIEGSENIAEKLNSEDDVIRELGYTSALLIKDQKERAILTDILLKSATKEKGNNLKLVLKVLLDYERLNRNNENDHYDDRILKQLVKWMFDLEDEEARIYIIESFCGNISLDRFFDSYNADIDIDALYFKLLKDKNPAVRNKAGKVFYENIALRDNGIKIFADELAKLEKSQKERIIDYLIEQVTTRRLFSLETSYQGYSESLKSNNSDEVILALIAGTVSNDNTCKDKTYVKILEILKDSNSDRRTADTAIICLAHFCTYCGNEIRITEDCDKDEFYDNLLVLLAEQYDKTESNFAKYMILKSFQDRIEVIWKENDVIKSVLKKACNNEDKRIRKIASEYIRRIALR